MVLVEGHIIEAGHGLAFCSWRLRLQCFAKNRQERSKPLRSRTLSLVVASKYVNRMFDTKIARHGSKQLEVDRFGCATER